MRCVELEDLNLLLINIIKKYELRIRHILDILTIQEHCLIFYLFERVENQGKHLNNLTNPAIPVDPNYLTGAVFF